MACQLISRQLGTSKTLITPEPLAGHKSHSLIFEMFTSPYLIPNEIDIICRLTLRSRL